MKTISADEWVRINRHMQSTGTATCDVSELILEADDLKRGKDDRAAYLLMCAARKVMDYQRRSSAAYSEKLCRPNRPIKQSKARR